MPTASEVAGHLDDVLGTRDFPDYPNALNGLQFSHRGPVRRVAVAVDVSRHVIEVAIGAGANFLVVHHGLFWGGLRPVVGAGYERIRKLVEADMAVYSSHLPLDAHDTLGNNVLLAARLGVKPLQPFAWFQGRAIGVAGEVDAETETLLAAADEFAREHGGRARASAFDPGRRTRRWAICTGAGASSDTLLEAERAGIDTLIVGEGPHHTAVEAPEIGLVIIYAGHYATETLGVQAVGAHLAARFGLPSDFIPAPTGS